VKQKTWLACGFGRAGVSKGFLVLGMDFFVHLDASFGRDRGCFQTFADVVDG
jgi:hypothetical protein